MGNFNCLTFVCPHRKKLTFRYCEMTCFGLFELHLGKLCILELFVFLNFCIIRKQNEVLDSIEIFAKNVDNKILSFMSMCGCRDVLERCLILFLFVCRGYGECCLVWSPEVHTIYWMVLYILKNLYTNWGVLDWTLGKE